MIDFNQAIHQGFLKIILSLWPLWLGLIVLRLLSEFGPILFNRWRTDKRFAAGAKWRSDQQLLQWLRNMKPSEFENYTAHLFYKLGYKTQAVGQSHDGGIDVIAEKDGITNYIQCKKFITREVTLGAMRDFYGALANNLANGKGYFITTNKFTLEAQRFAEDKPIELVDGFQLIRYIRMTEKDTLPINAAPAPRLCPSCGGNLVERKSKFGPFYGCSNYPKCKYTANKA